MKGFGFQQAGPGAQPAPKEPTAPVIQGTGVGALHLGQTYYRNPDGSYSNVPPQLPQVPALPSQAPSAPPQMQAPGAPQFDPAAAFNQPATPGVLPSLSTGGVNPYLSDPLMSSYYRLQNPLYQNQQQMDFYGDPEIFNAPTAAGSF